MSGDSGNAKRATSDTNYSCDHEVGAFTRKPWNMATDMLFNYHAMMRFELTKGF
jgi:hypothetical protein